MMKERLSDYSKTDFNIEEIQDIVWENVVIGVAFTDTVYKHQAEHEAAYNLLYYMVKNHFVSENADELIIRCAKDGKPYFENSGLYFNISHCRGMVVCGLSYDCEVGIDAENVRPVRENIARRIMTAGEYDKYLESDKSDKFFFKVWTYKESVLKLTGEGIRTELSSLDSLNDDRFEVYPVEFTGHGMDYLVCVARKNTFK